MWQARKSTRDVRDPVLRWVFGITAIMFLGLWFAPSPLQAINPTGTIVGTVSDASGAVVADTTVTVTNEGTGLSRTTKTGAAGDFTFPLLNIGNYSLKVEKVGFQTFVREHIVLQVDQNVTVLVTLQVGAVVQQVTVTGTTSGVDLVTATIKEVVDQQRIVDLPLNGRDPLELIMLMPGVNYDTDSVAHGQGQHEGLSISGNRPGSNYYLMDGVDAVDSYLAVAPIFPSPDALQEFTVHTSEFSAEYGRNSGGLVNVATRSGTNSIHGSGFEFVRNTKLNASNFFANAAHLAVPPFKLNQYGGTIGGPIKKDKTFFFAYFQQTEQRKDEVTTIPTVLTPEERNGLSTVGANFSDICPGSQCPIDPRTGQPFPSNTIPVNRLDQGGVNIVNKYMPLPNAGSSYVFSAPNAYNNDNLAESQFIVRLDHSISDKDRLFGRYFFNNDGINGGISGNYPDTPWNKKFKNQNFVLNWTRMIAPTLINSASVGFNRMYHWRGPAADYSFADVGIAYNAFGTGTPPVPETAQIGISGSMSNSSSSFQQPRTVYEGTDTLSWVKGPHSLVFGVDIKRESVNRWENYFTDPDISFDGYASGNPLADLLLGLPNFFRQDNQVVSELRHTGVGVYAEDEYKVKSNFSATLGLRWEPYLPPVDQLNDQICFDPTFTKHSTYYPTAPPGVLFAGGPVGRGFGSGDAGCPRQLIPTRWANFAPRVGLVYDPFKKGKTAVRVSYGVFWDEIRLIGYNRFSTSMPFDQPQLIYSPGGPSNNYAPSLFGTSMFTNAGLVDPFPTQVPRAPAARAAFSPLYGGNWPQYSLEDVLNPNWNEPYIQEWNFNIQQQLWNDWTLTVAYVANKATHLPVSRDYNWAVPLPFSVESYAQQLSDENARRRFSAIQCKNGVTGTSAACYTFFEMEDTGANSNYNSLQITMNRKFSHGLTLLGSYVWSKYLDIFSFEGEGSTGPRIPYDFGADYGPSDNDVPHHFVVSYIWQLPKAKSLHGFAGQVVNGWQINGITTFNSGTPFSCKSGEDRSLTAIGSDNCDFVPGVSPTEPSGRPTSEVITAYFNPAAFQQPAPGTFGDVSRNHLRGPGIKNFDFAIFKDFPISERLGKIQFRNEYFNFFNNVNFYNPNNYLTSGPAFGTITGARDPRFIQFAFKWIF